MHQIDPKVLAAAIAYAMNCHSLDSKLQTPDADLGELLAPQVEEYLDRYDIYVGDAVTGVPEGQITMKQSLWLALELQRIYLTSFEPVAHPNFFGRKHCAWMLNQIITLPEDQLAYDKVQRWLGHVMATLIERRDATGPELAELVRKAKAYDMTVKGQIDWSRGGGMTSDVQTTTEPPMPNMGDTTEDDVPHGGN